MLAVTDFDLTDRPRCRALGHPVARWGPLRPCRRHRGCHTSRPSELQTGPDELRIDSRAWKADTAYDQSLFGETRMAKPATIKIRLNSTAGTGHFYVTRKNARTMTDKMTVRKYDPVARKHVEYKEGKIK